MKKSIFKHKIGVLILAILFSAAGFYGCNESSTNPTQSDNLIFSSMSSTDSIGDSQNILILDTVKILIQDIKLNVANNNQDSVNFKVGPYVLFLNLTAGVTTISSAIIPAGEYQKIKFEIHKLNDNEPVPDPEFADNNGRYSVIVKGWYLGNYFIYKSTKSAHQILNFPSSMPITTEYVSNITLHVKPYIWFISNGVYLDPGVAANSNDIDNNIKNNINNNFKAFRDNDRNGVPD
ncbi:MAG: hypothetical protein JW917_04090 [Ignavibacteria bacterium]|nr:hypothetical protein [Ignavibacteria bacterium]